MVPYLQFNVSNDCATHSRQLLLLDNPERGWTPTCILNILSVSFTCLDFTKRFVLQTDILLKPQIAWKHTVSTEEKYKMKLTPDAPINNLPL